MQPNIQRFRFEVVIRGKVQLAVYAFFVDGMLIDTGHSNAQNIALSRFENLPIEQIFISHHHEDHSGNLNALQKIISCPTYAYPLCVEIMKSPPKVCFVERKTWGRNTAVDNMIGIEKEIKTAHLDFKIIHTPGHSDDHVCLYEPNQGWLFSGDLYVQHYIRYFMETESVATQIKSIQKVLGLDFNRLLCSHNPVEENGKENFRRKLQFLEDFYGNVVDLHQKGMTVRSIMKTLQMKERWMLRLFSSGWLSAANMVKSVIRDEAASRKCLN